MMSPTVPQTAPAGGEITRAQVGGTVEEGRADVVDDEVDVTEVIVDGLETLIEFGVDEL